MKRKTRNWKKNLRYLRWTSKAVFLVLFLIPVAYLALAPTVPVNSLFFGELYTSFLSVPINQAVCSIWTSYFGNEKPGAWFLCPVGGIQSLLTGHVQIETIIAIFLFVTPIILLGNFFCSWACPVGTLIDSFDKAIEKFFPKVEAKREHRAENHRQNKRKEIEKEKYNLVCPSCPINKVKHERYGLLAKGIFASSLLGSAILKFPVFCAICPMGILSRGMIHIRSVFFITGRKLAVLLELLPVPVIAVFLSLRERRFWCKKLCPVGALLNVTGNLNPFIKMKVTEEKCVMKGCPEDCEDGHLDYCAYCRLIDDYKCEKVCPVDISLLNHDSLARCTKCLECYIVCDYNAIKINLISKPDIFRIGGFLKRSKSNRENESHTKKESSTKQTQKNQFSEL